MLEGKGLGLFMIKSQIDDLGGIIDVQRKVGVGTTFMIALPV
jgi:chemotaxis protein histidine kinase CheA